MLVAIITIEKAQTIAQTEYAPGLLYNPIELPDNRWCISFPEAQHLQVSDIVEIADYTPLQN